RPRAASPSIGNWWENPPRRHDSRLPLFPAAPALPAAPVQLLRRRAGAPLLRRRRQSRDPPGGRRAVLPARRRGLRAPRRAPPAIFRRLLALRNRSRAAPRLGPRRPRVLPAPRRLRSRRVSRRDVAPLPRVARVARRVRGAGRSPPRAPLRRAR